MSPEARSSVAALARLRTEISSDLDALRKRALEGTDVLSSWSSVSRDKVIVSAVALHGWYTCLETLLERICREIDQEVPKGNASHRKLLVQAMTEVPQIRPLILSRTLLQDLLSLLSFRHFFRHAYAVELDPEKVREELTRLARIKSQIEQELLRFDEFLLQSIEVLEKKSGGVDGT